jgi:hypothetical protein
MWFRFLKKSLPGDLEINYRLRTFLICPFNVSWFWNGGYHKRIPIYFYYILINRR